MKLRTFLFVFILIAIGLFTLVNWGTFSQTTRLSVIFGEVQAPLGLLMVGVIAVLSAIYLVVLARTEALALREFRKLSRELDEARKLADESEESRFEELRSFLATELAEIRRALGDAQSHTIKWDEETSSDSAENAGAST